jgi:hypothetical protein
LVTGKNNEFITPYLLNKNLHRVPEKVAGFNGEMHGVRQSEGGEIIKISPGL